jgi:hypothetical protein
MPACVFRKKGYTIVRSFYCSGNIVVVFLILNSSFEYREDKAKEDLFLDEVGKHDPGYFLVKSSIPTLYAYVNWT